MYWVAKLFLRLKFNWEFVEFDKSKTIKNKYKIKQKIKQKLKDKVVDIKKEIKWLFKENFVYFKKKKLNKAKKIKELKIMN